jgi:uncharacterized protein (TIGR02145 family)
MKNILFSTLVICALIFIQGCVVSEPIMLATSEPRITIISKPKMVVYVRGDMEHNESKVLYTDILEIFVNSGKYDPVERSEDFLNEIAKEHSKQRSGAIDDQQIATLGKQFGAQYVCVTEVNAIYDSKKIAARLIDVETAVVKAASSAESSLDNLEKFKRVANEIVNPILQKYTSHKNVNSTENTLTKEKQNSATSNSDTFTDFRDGQKYRIVKIGSLVWMAENLRHAASGKCYNKSESNCEKYGRLYDWNTAKTVCPDGWHLPEGTEWGDLVKAVGGQNADGSKHLKAKSGWSWSLWFGTNGNGTDTYGFSALPGGGGYYKYLFFEFDDLGSTGYWWSASAGASDNTYYRLMIDATMNWSYHNGGYFFSVRCVRD